MKFYFQNILSNHITVKKVSVQNAYTWRIWFYSKQH